MQIVSRLIFSLLKQTEKTQKYPPKFTCCVVKPKPQAKRHKNTVFVVHLLIIDMQKGKTWYTRKYVFLFCPLINHLMLIANQKTEQVITTIICNS